jgi:protein-glutamine gamma-glutamyltransferase
MRRTLLLYVFPAGLVATGWLALEGRAQAGKVMLAVLLAAVPAVVRPLWGRVAAAAAAGVTIAVVALSLPLTWRVDEASALAAGRVGDGIVAFYAVAVPFDPAVHPRMHGVLVLAAFLFCLALALTIAARRSLLAGVVAATGAAWPATINPGTNDLRTGAFLLAAVLVLAAGLRPPGPVALRAIAVAGGLALAAGLAASSSPSVAKGAFLDWEHWRLGGSERRVSVAYVWNSQFGGIQFPKKRTTLLTIAAPSRPRYWRATVLETFDGLGWVERPAALDVVATGGATAPRGRRLIRQKVEVEGLVDSHLVGGEIPVAFAGGPTARGFSRRGGIFQLPTGTRRGDQYTVWSRALEPSLAALRRSPPRYPAAIASIDLTVPGLEQSPRFGLPGRPARVRQLLHAGAAGHQARAYRPLYAVARAVTTGAETPYAAAAALESWFRLSGDFRYEEQPPSVAGRPPLVAFVTRTRAGYCQHFAGAMALMLRYLGVPARVAVGFTSGRYDLRSGTWRVTDHDAHAWVEVWFAGFGWLPFDPTPTRGTLNGSYTAASRDFDASAAVGPLAAILGFPKTILKGRLERRAAGGLARGARVGAGHVTGGASPAKAGFRRRGIGLLSLLLLVAAGLVTVLALLKAALRRGRFLTRDPRRLASACRRDLADFVADQGVAVPPSASASELAGIVRDEFNVDAAVFASAVGRARFGPPDEAAQAAGDARRELRTVRRSLRRRLGARSRALGLLSPRSLAG